MKPVKLSENAVFTDHGCTVWRGWSEETARALVEASRDPLVKRFTPKDSEERFKDMAAANQWYQEKRPVLYSLQKDGQLAGVTWFTPYDRPDLGCDYTFAIRMYPAARGRHLAKPFAEMAEADFRSKHQPSGIWLETDTDNVAAQRLYESLGYQHVSTTGGRMTMRKR